MVITEINITSIFPCDLFLVPCYLLTGTKMHDFMRACIMHLDFMRACIMNVDSG